MTSVAVVMNTEEAATVAPRRSRVSGTTVPKSPATTKLTAIAAAMMPATMGSSNQNQDTAPATNAKTTALTELTKLREGRNASR